MKVDKDIVITALSILLLIGIISFVVLGCVNIIPFPEHFEVSSKKKKDDSKKKDDEEEGGDVEQMSAELTPRERELFEDLKDNKLTNEQIGELVSGGVLTEKLVEKFLDQLNSAPVDDAPSSASKKKAAKIADPVPEEDAVEGFTGSVAYAKF